MELDKTMSNEVSRPILLSAGIVECGMVSYLSVMKVPRAIYSLFAEKR
jgi:hypothetical protein